MSPFFFSTYLERVSEASFQPSEHQMTHGHVNHGFTDIRAVLVVPAQPAVTAQPGEGSRHYPAPAEHLEALLVFGPRNPFHTPTPLVLDILPEAAAVFAIPPNQLEPGQ